MRSALCLAALLVAGFGSSVALAGEPAKNVSLKATTSELPAALMAVSPDQGKILSLNDARQIRGEGFDWRYGPIVGFGNVTITNNININIRITNINNSFNRVSIR